MNFSELKTELSDRGFTYLSDTRRGQFINRACARLDNMYRWPYREASGVGIAPLTVSDLGQIEAVTNQSQSDYPLSESSYIDLTNWFGDLAITGTPSYWYRAYVAGNPTVATYPVSTSDSIGVQYWKAPPILSGTAVPLAPLRFHLLYVDMAVQLAYRDSDNHAMAESLQIEINRQTFEMIEDLLPQQGPTSQSTGWLNSEDW